MITYGINDNRKLTQDGSAADGIKPRIYFRERPIIALASENIHAGDSLRLAVDVDKDFLATAPMAVATGEGEEGSAQFALDCATSRFEEVINGRACLVCAYIQLTRWSGGNCEVLVDDRCYAGSLVSVAGDDVEILPKPVTIPVPNAGDAGKVIGVDDNGNYALQEGGGSAEQATDAEIDARESTTHAITPNNLDYAGRSVVPSVTTIPSATSAYALLDATATTNNHSWQYAHAPSEASTYTLPAVADTTVAHRIKLTIDFATIQTYAFEDAQGTAITPLFTPTISAGDVYEFDCEYSVAKSTWLIWPHKQGAVSDDYVMQSEVGAANGVAGLNANGRVPSGQLQEAGLAWGGEYGIVRLGNGAYGSNSIQWYSTGEGRCIVAAPQTKGHIDVRYSLPSGVINASNLNYAVTAALTDSRKIQLTDAQKASAQDTIGAYGTLHLNAAPTASTVGAFGQRAIVDATGKCYTCTAVTVDETDPENPVTTYTWQEAVQLDSNGKVPSGELPIGNVTRLGIVRAGREYGINSDNNGMLKINAATIASIDSRSTLTLPIVPSTLNYAVRSVLPNITEIPAATSAYTLTAQDATTNNHCCTYEHAPESAPTYTLPAITGNAVKREIMLTVRFSSSVLTYAFEDSAGNPITPLPLAGTIADGSVVCFRCTWEALLGQWVIMPVMLGTYSA